MTTVFGDTRARHSTAFYLLKVIASSKGRISDVFGWIWKAIWVEQNTDVMRKPTASV